MSCLNSPRLWPCGKTPVTDLARLSLEADDQRGHGDIYDGLNDGCIDTNRLRTIVADGPVPKIVTPEGRSCIVLAVDVSNWLRPDAETSPDRAFCHTYARCHGQA